MDTYKVIGVMSGTSLDGVDVAFCTFKYDSKKWNYVINKAETYSYDQDWKEKLSSIENKSALELAQTNINYGHYLGKFIKKFISTHNIQPDFISSHGHTIFHQPEKKITVQIGCGSSISAETLLPVICDFRTLDVALGGQGAPLVPIGDKLLFSEYNYCLNLGGFANISFENNNKRKAFDICPVNIALNFLAAQAGKDYDKNGELGKQGSVNNELLEKLNTLDFYQKNPPKSLGKEWLLNNFLPLLHESKISVHDKLRTVYEHIAAEISKCIDSNGKILITGGGAHNSFLIERIKSHLKNYVFIPDNQTIDFKEALIFAFLGVLRFRNEINTLKSVTGAAQDSVGGCIYYHK